MHDIHLRMAPDDWSTLQERFRENTCYPADLAWRDRSVTMVGGAVSLLGKPQRRQARAVEGRLRLGLSRA